MLERDSNAWPLQYHWSTVLYITIDSEESECKWIIWQITYLSFFRLKFQNCLSSVNCNDVRGELQQHGGHCKLIQNISTNIWSLGTYRDPKLGQIYFLPISYKITISWLYPLNSSWFIFSLHDSENHLSSLANRVTGKRLLIGYFFNTLRKTTD